jgi:hypothetical protein
VFEPIRAHHCNAKFARYRISMTRFGTFGILMAAVVGLAGCASEEAASRFLVQPDRYVLYSCPEIATTAQTIAIRQRELEGLMAKAGEGAGGQLASTMAYRPEYAQLRGEMDQLRKAAADKNCRFTPGGRASDQSVR